MSGVVAARGLSGMGRRALDLPLRVRGRRFLLWGIVVACYNAIVIASSPSVAFVDFPQFWAAGNTVGTLDMLDRARHGNWEVLHGITPDLFPYTPGAAWLFTPFSAFSIPVAFWLHAAAMTLLVGVAGVLGAHIFGLRKRVGLVVAFAWSPCLAAVAFGQNAPLALVFILIAIEGLRRDSDLLAGIGVGLLLYKPTLGIPLLGLLLLRRRWSALSVAAVAAVAWYLASVAATAGDWFWPLHLLIELGDYYGPNTAFNAAKATSIPGILVGRGGPPVLAWGLCLLIIVVAIPRLLRAPIVEAAAAVCLVGLAASPHSLNYEAAVALPAILWLMGGTGTGIREPVRTWLIAILAVAGLLLLVSLWAGLSSVGLAVVALTIIWVSGWQRYEAEPGGPADAPASDRRFSAPRSTSSAG